MQKMAPRFQYTFGLCVCKSSAKKTPVEASSEPQNSHALNFARDVHAILLIYLNFSLGKRAFEGRKSKSAVTGDFSSA